MKKHLLLFLFLIFAVATFGQTKNSTTISVRILKPQSEKEKKPNKNEEKK